MKSNREFLNEIYAKADKLQREKDKKKKVYKIYYRLTPIAMAIILIPSVFFLKDNLGYKEIHKPSIMRALIDDPISYFYEAEFILIGETREIEKSKYVKEDNYIYTDIVLSINEVLLGEIEGGEIKVRVDGGKVKSEKIYSKMESEFIKGNKSLLFLYRDDEGIFHLIKENGQFKEIGKNLFQDKTGREYSIDEIKNIIKGDS